MGIIHELISRFRGEQVSFDPTKVSYTEGVPRTARLEQIHGRRESSISRLHLEQGPNRYSFDFEGEVQMATSEQGETIAIVGRRAKKRLSQAEKSDFEWGLHIWWGGEHRLVRADEKDTIIQIVDIGKTGEHVIYRVTTIVPGWYMAIPSLYRLGLKEPPYLIETIKARKHLVNIVLESNKTEVLPIWEKMYREMEQQSRQYEKDHALAAGMRRWGGGPSLKGPPSLRR